MTSFNYNTTKDGHTPFSRIFPIGSLLTATKEHWVFFRDILKETGQSASERGRPGESYLILDYWSDIGEYGVTCLRIRDNRKISLNSSWCSAAFNISRPE